jgi:uncharacterized protein YcfJ
VVGGVLGNQVGGGTGRTAATVAGAVAGGAIGGLTDPCTLNLGDPYWHDHGGRAEYDRRCGRHHRHHDRDGYPD